MADDTQKLESPDEKELTAGDTASLESGDDIAALPDGYEVLVSSNAEVEDQVEQAEQFGEELNSTQNIIQRYSQQYDDIKNKIKETQEMFRNIMDNDEELQQLEEQAKTVTQDLRTKKQRIKESPEAVQIQMKIKEFKEEKKEIEDTLNGHLLRYYQMTGSLVIEEPDGTEREFKINARLKGKKRSED